MKFSYQNYKITYGLWRNNPNNDDFRIETRRRKSIFKSNLRTCIRNKKKIEADKLAEYCFTKHFRSFWENVIAIRTRKYTITNKLLDTCGEKT